MALKWSQMFTRDQENARREAAVLAGVCVIDGSIMKSSEALERVRERLVEYMGTEYGAVYMCNVAKHDIHDGRVIVALFEALVADDVSTLGNGFTDEFEFKSDDPVRRSAYAAAHPGEPIPDRFWDLNEDIAYLGNVPRFHNWLHNMRRWMWLTLMIQHYKSLGQ